MSVNTENIGLLNNDNTINNEKIKEKTKKIDIKEICYLAVKRIVSFIGGLVGVILLIPLTIILYIVRIILKENDGPLFYVQLRVGKNGKEFKMYKYRSMCMNADEKLEEYLENNEEARKEYQQYKKLKDDPRITKFGKFVRKTSIDELPQLLNCLLGSMDLVSCRPYLHREIKDMGEDYYTIISVKPGITGYWQVNGRSSTDFKTRVKMDVDYIKTKTLWGDFKFLVKTFFMIFRKEGAI